MTVAIHATRVLMRQRIASPRMKQAGLPAKGADTGPRTNVEWAGLIARVASRGDREAFKSLFEHFAPRVKAFLLKGGCSSDEAEEIAQNTLIAVWRKADQFDPNTTGATAWIFTIARNLRIDAVRQAARRGRHDTYSELADAPDPAEAPDIVVSRVEDTVRVKAAIEQLSLEQSRIIKLSFVEERPHPEIANLLSLPLGTVKSRIRLAMNRLRDLLDEKT